MASVGAEDNTDVIKRPLASFPPDIWGDRFINFTPQDLLKMESYGKQIEPLKEEVKMMLMDKNMDLTERMNLIDAVERLGISYHFQNEINELLDQFFKAYTANSFQNDDCDLYNTALQFRIFRQHGYAAPCDVFNKFTDEEGKFKETLRSDLRGMVSLYDAAHLRIHDENILEGALDFTTTFLSSISTYSELASHKLKHALHLGIPRVEIRRAIQLYEEDESLNAMLLHFAKIDYNRLQLLHRQELDQILRWWKELDYGTKLPYARNRCVECHFWTIGMYYEPQYSFARMLLVKALLIISIVDDTYDAYGTFEELQLLTQAFERWDLSEMELLPEDYMKLVFKYVINIHDEFAEEMTKKGKPYSGQFAKDSVMDLIRSYFVEAKWVKEKYVPTFEEYMVNARITGVAQYITISSMLGMEEITEVKLFEQVLQAPKAIRACEVIARLMDDIVTHEEEQARGQVPSGVECYMKEFGTSEEEAVGKLNKMIEDAWKDLNEELLRIKPSSNNTSRVHVHVHDHFPMPVLERVFNYPRVMDALYKVTDGYTYSAKIIKDDIIGTYAQSFPI